MSQPMLDSDYNDLLVVLSLFVAILASYTSLSMAGRIRTAKGSATYWWWAGGSFAMGLGIWSMHFIGMLAFRLPIDLGYDLWITLLSLGIAIAASAFALWVACRRKLTLGRLLFGASVLGLAVAGMHYSGMAAMRMTPGIIYDPAWFAASIAIAVVSSGAALRMTARIYEQASHPRVLRIGTAAIMGCAIVGMHYSGMAAAQFPLGSICGAARFGMDTYWLSTMVVLVTVAVLAIALLISILDRRFESHTGALNVSLNEANETLRRLALHDALTGLPNRALLEDRIEQTRQAAIRRQVGFSLLFMDLDGFKAVNDAHGHAVGDLLLVEVARRIRDSIGEDDTVARLGGDEFVVLMQNGSPDDVATLAESIVGLIAQPFFIQGYELRLSTSIGIAIYPQNGQTSHALLVNADAAMYHSKDMGRNRHSFFDPSMNIDAEDHLRLVHDLRLAIERHEFILHYQPKFNDPDGPVVGAEALVRWRHPIRGMVSPDCFIPVAEKTGLIIAIDNWVLDEACRQLRIWRETENPDWTIAVNLSALQFSHPKLVDSVRSVLERHRLPASSLILEVTESTAMRNVQASMDILQRLHDMGVRIAIDDFGTGYSSLLYLKRLPASELKIDRAFVRDLVHDSEDAAIVSAIVALGKALKLNVVAEGVETLTQQNFLTGLGCNSLQGYLLGRPLPAEEFLDASRAVH
jgi:diguanylate cyclase (GGDEF)-like protein